MRVKLNADVDTDDRTGRVSEAPNGHAREVRADTFPNMLTVLSAARWVYRVQ
jgi:hypothetical protein